MGKGKIFLERVREGSEYELTGVQKQPIVEISGQCRVLIENHFGVAAYSRESVIVKVKFGQVEICGCGLEIARMTKEQLVVRGNIHGVTLQGRR